MIRIALNSRNLRRVLRVFTFLFIEAELTNIFIIVNCIAKRQQSAEYFVYLYGSLTVCV